MVIEDIADSEDLEGERHKENVVRRIASLNNIESAGQENPPAEEKLPEKCASVFPKIAEWSISFRRHGMTIDVHAFEDFVGFPVALATRTKYVDVVSVLTKRT